MSTNTGPIECPSNIAACVAAPRATAKSGLTARLGSSFNSSLSRRVTNGMRVEPPTKTRSSMLSIDNPESRSVASTLFKVWSTRGWISSSKSPRLIVIIKFNGWPSFSTMNSSAISAVADSESVFLAASQAWSKRYRVASTTPWRLAWIGQGHDSVWIVFATRVALR